MCGATITSPLDVVKTRLQSDLYRQRTGMPHQHTGIGGTLLRACLQFVDTGRLLVEIARREGASALFKGLGPTLVGVIPARAINFYTYGNGKRFIADHFNSGIESTPVHLSAAAFAGLVTATATNPIWVVKTRLQLESQRNEARSQLDRSQAVGKHQGARPIRSATHIRNSRSLISTPLRSAQFFRAARPPKHPTTGAIQMTLNIVQKEGIKGFYRGLSASYLGVSESTIQWVLYEQLKRWQSPTPNSSRWANTVGAAGTAKLIATVITYPHEVVRTRLRQQPERGVSKYTGLLQSFKLVWLEEGLMGLYGGLSAHLMRVIPNAIVTFSIYELVLALGARDL
ncbi:Pyrimidine nucleotide transporter, mitochondrial [Malassezia yamatoensis]|uniref:Pyrimidine nucleotide transporter, mitochondrial n=1 Tax=Malassezia yamatoensis TaxID=253288 RepID=A0AAJ5YU25_9BASI|nr:Pyrimidine nucleotide transporter, mitochondrial [Malassezia yamatoensis]